MHEGARLPPGLRMNVTAHVSHIEETNLEEFEMAVNVQDGESIEPQSYTEAMSLPEREVWKAAMLEELSAHDKAGTWSVEDVPSEANVVGCRWVFKIKRDAQGNPVRYKARLVAQGFSQVLGVDYADTYAPTARLATTHNCW